MGMRRTNPAPKRAPLRKTAYGRRVTSKTFTILGASTPEIRISTMGASRKTKIMDHRSNCKRCRPAVSKMHNGSLRQNRLILGIDRHYVWRNVIDVGDLIPQRVDNMTERVRSWDN